MKNHTVVFIAMNERDELYVFETRADLQAFLAANPDWYARPYDEGIVMRYDTEKGDVTVA